MLGRYSVSQLSIRPNGLDYLNSELNIITK